MATKRGKKKVGRVKSPAKKKKTAPTRAKPVKKRAAKAHAKPATAAGAGLHEGDRVPRFSLPDQGGTTVSSESLAGRPYVLYFYPKDDTPGCTREACGFRDDHGKFQAAGLRVIGVSPDKPESHSRFRQKYGLNFTLLSDADKVLANAFGVWVKKQNYGREYMGIQRSTFLVGANGKIEKAWRAVKVDGHVTAVLAAASAPG